MKYRTSQELLGVLLGATAVAWTGRSASGAALLVIFGATLVLTGISTEKLLRAILRLLPPDDPYRQEPEDLGVLLNSMTDSWKSSSDVSFLWLMADTLNFLARMGALIAESWWASWRIAIAATVEILGSSILLVAGTRKYGLIFTPLEALLIMACAIGTYGAYTARVKPLLVAGGLLVAQTSLCLLVTAPTADDVVDYVADGLWVCGIALLALTYSAERRRGSSYRTWVMAGQLALGLGFIADFASCVLGIPGLLQHVDLQTAISVQSPFVAAPIPGLVYMSALLFKGPVRAGPIMAA